MPSYSSAPSGSPAAGAARGLRAGLLAVLCVLLPLAGHALSQGHAPRWFIVAAVAVVAVPAAVVLTRRRLTDAQAVGVLAASQLAYHAAYSLPGACRAVTGADGTSAGVPTWVEHGANTQLPSGVLLSGHLVTLLVAARLLGVTERLLWQSKPLLTAVRRLLSFVWPLLRGPRARGPVRRRRRSTLRLKPAPWARLRPGRAPPSGGLSPLISSRPASAGGPCLP